ncbi:MAG TPA: hypothetical protein DCZ94_00440 [Lentisphaeria bacterium]|nr:MAG: hypothetical protein A2X48_12000 [Lentisphaerae bacterium GWF2_49_21]HBC85399.1 hypothetical protein [Lentisphaeria bacterium]
MKLVLNFIILALLASILSGCSSSRTIPFPYDQVSAAAQEKFYVNTWSEFDTKKSWKTENPGKNLKLVCYDWEFPDTKIYCQVKVYAEKGGGSTVYVYVKDYQSWFGPFTNWSWTYGGKVLDLFEKRMASGAWDPLPWAEKSEERKIK